MAKCRQLYIIGNWSRVSALIVWVLVGLCVCETLSASRPVFAAETKNKYQRSKLTNDQSEGLADKRRMLLTTGEDKAVDLDFDANAGANGIAIGNPQIVTTTLVRIGEKRQIVFKPLKAGETTVSVRDADGVLKLIFTVRVTGSNLLRIAGEIRNILRDVEGLDIRVVGPKVVIDGEVLVPNDYARLITVIMDKAYADYVISMVQLAPMALLHLAKKIQEDINTFAPNVKTRVVNQQIWLEGSVDDGAAAARAVDMAERYLPQLQPAPLMSRDPSPMAPPKPKGFIANYIVINAPKQKRQDKLVRVTMHFVELSKDYNKVFGFKWQPGFTTDPQITLGTTSTGSTGAQTSASTFTATISSLVPKLLSAQNAGYARVLKTGTIIVRSGNTAKLSDQIQIPTTAISTDGKVASKTTDVGLELAVTPTILGQSEDVMLSMNVAQKNVVGRVVAGADPIVSAHKIDTIIYVKAQESAAIAGVTSTDVGTDFNKDDPKSGTYAEGTEPIFNLHRSKAYRKKKSQFVVFVTPQIIENASDGTDDLKKNFRVKVK